MTTVTQVENAQPRWRALIGNQQFILFLVLLAMIAFFTYMNSIFFSTSVATNVLMDWGPLVLLALAETFVIISGGIDLSVGAICGISGVVAAIQMRNMTEAGQGSTLTLLVGLLVCMTVGVIAGLVNATLINVAKLVPFVATLATMGACWGLALVFTGGGPIGGGPKEAIQLSVAWLGPFSTPLLVVIAIVVICWLLLHKTRFGRYTYAIGSNAFAARAAGIGVKKHLTYIYVLSGFLSSLAGYFFYLRLGSGAPTSGFGGELDAIAAVVIGGAALMGGIGRISGTVFGALILTTVTSGLIIIGVEPDWKQVVVAVLIAVAVTIQGLRRNESRAS